LIQVMQIDRHGKVGVRMKPLSPVTPLAGGRQSGKAVCPATVVTMGMPRRSTSESGADRARSPVHPNLAETHRRRVKELESPLDDRNRATRLWGSCGSAS
jgi:hypothetical protein